MADQPQLPGGILWPEVTEAWWETIGQSPEVDGFTIAQWQFMLDTALVHADVWAGNLDRLPELRVRLQTAGLTPTATPTAKAAEKGATALDQLAARRANRGPEPARTRRAQA